MIIRDEYKYIIYVDTKRIPYFNSHKFIILANNDCGLPVLKHERFILIVIKRCY